MASTRCSFPHFSPTLVTTNYLKVDGKFPTTLRLVGIPINVAGVLVFFKLIFSETKLSGLRPGLSKTLTTLIE